MKFFTFASLNSGTNAAHVDHTSPPVAALFSCTLPATESLAFTTAHVAKLVQAQPIYCMCVPRSES